MLFINFLCLYCLIVLAACHTISKSIAHENSYDEPGSLREYDYLSDYAPRYERHNKPRKEERIHKVTKQAHGSTDTTAEPKHTPTMSSTTRINDQHALHSFTSLWRNLKHKKKLTKTDPTKLNLIESKSLYGNSQLESPNIEGTSIRPHLNKQKSNKLRQANKRKRESSRRRSSRLPAKVNEATVFNFATVKHDFDDQSDKLPNSYKTFQQSQADNDNLVNVDGKTVYVLSDLNKPVSEQKVFNFASANPMIMTTSYPLSNTDEGDNTGRIEDLLNSIKAKVVELLADHSSHFHDVNMIANAVTVTTFKMAPSLFVGYSSLPFRNEPITQKQIDFNVTSLSGNRHDIQLRCCKDMKAIKSMCNKIIQRVTADFKKEVHETVQAIKSISKHCRPSTTPVKTNTEKQTTKKKCSPAAIVESALIESGKTTLPSKPTTAIITTVKTSQRTEKATKHASKKVRQVNETISRIWKHMHRNRYRTTHHTSPKPDDDYIVLSLYEQMLTKSDQVNRLGITAPVKRSYNNEKALLSKRNTETLTDLSLKENIQNIFNDGEVMPETAESGINVSDIDANMQIDTTGKSIDEMKQTESEPEEITIAGLSDKLAYKDYINGFKYYLKFQKELKKENFSDLVKYQAHRHHNVDDIGKFILDKLPQVPNINRDKRRFFDDDTMDDQDVSTRSEDSWFKKHFYFFIDNGPPKKFHTSQTVPLKSHAKSTSAYEDVFSRANEYNNNKKHIRRARSLDTTSAYDLESQGLNNLVGAVTRKARHKQVLNLLDRVALRKANEQQYSTSDPITISETAAVSETVNKIKRDDYEKTQPNTETCENDKNPCDNASFDSCTGKVDNDCKESSNKTKEENDDCITLSDCKKINELGINEHNDALNKIKAKISKTKRSLQINPQRFSAFKHLKNILLGEQYRETLKPELEFAYRAIPPMYQLPNVDKLFNQIPNITDLEATTVVKEAAVLPSLVGDFSHIQTLSDIWTPKYLKFEQMRPQTSTTKRKASSKKPSPKQFYPMSRFVTTKGKYIHNKILQNDYMEELVAKYKDFASPIPRLLFHFKHARPKTAKTTNMQPMLHDFLFYKTLSSFVDDYTPRYEAYEKYYRTTGTKSTEKEKEGNEIHSKEREIGSDLKSKIENEKGTPRARYGDYSVIQSSVLETEPLLRMFEIPSVTPNYQPLYDSTKKLYEVSRKLTEKDDDFISETIAATEATREPYKQNSYKKKPYNQYKKTFTSLSTHYNTQNTHKGTQKPAKNEQDNYKSQYSDNKKYNKLMFKELAKDPFNEMYKPTPLTMASSTNVYTTPPDETKEPPFDFEDFYIMNSDILHVTEKHPNWQTMVDEATKMLQDIDDITGPTNVEVDNVTLEPITKSTTPAEIYIKHRQKSTPNKGSKMHKKITSNVKKMHTIMVNQGNPKINHKRLVMKNAFDETMVKMKDSKDMFKQMKISGTKYGDSPNVFESQLTKNNFQSSGTANKMLIDTTLLAYDDGADILTTDQDSALTNVSKSYSKKHTPPKQFFSTPVPMKYNEFENFLKDNYLDLFSLTSPLENVPRLYSFDLKHRLYANPTKIIKMDRQFSKDSQKADVDTVASKTNRIKQLFHMTSPVNNTSNVSEMTKVTLFRDISLIQEKKPEKRKIPYYTTPNRSFDTIDNDIEDNVFPVVRTVSCKNSTTYKTRKGFNGTNGLQNPVEEITERSPNYNRTKVMKTPQKIKHIRYKSYKKYNPRVLYPLPLAEHKIVTRDQSYLDTHNSLLYTQVATFPYNYGTISTKNLHISEASQPDHEFTTFYSHHGPAVKFAKDKKSYPQQMLFSDHVCKFDVLSNDQIQMPKRHTNSDYENADLEGPNYSVTKVTKATRRLNTVDYTKPNVIIHIDLPTYYLPNTEVFETNLVYQKKMSWHEHIVRCISGLALVELLNKYGFIKTIDAPHDKNLNTSKVFSENHPKRYMEVKPAYTTVSERRGRYLQNDSKRVYIICRPGQTNKISLDLFKRLQEADSTREAARTASRSVPPLILCNYDYVEENEKSGKEEGDKSNKDEKCKKEDEKCKKDDEKCKNEDEKCKKDDEKCKKEDEKCKNEDEKRNKDKEKSNKEDEKCKKEDEKRNKDREKSKKEDEKREKDREKSNKEEEECDKNREKSNKEEECNKEDKEKQGKEEKDGGDKKPHDDDDDYFADYNKGKDGRFLMSDEQITLIPTPIPRDIVMQTDKPSSDDDDDDNNTPEDDDDIDDIKVMMANDPEPRDDFNVNFEKIVIEKGFKVFSKKMQNPPPIDTLPPPPPNTDMDDDKNTKKAPPYYTHRATGPLYITQELTQARMNNQTEENLKEVNKELDQISRLHEEIQGKMKFLRNKLRNGFMSKRKKREKNKRKREKTSKHKKRNAPPQTYTAKDVSALEVIVDLVKNLEPEADDSKSTRSINDKSSNEVRFAMQHKPEKKADNSSLELHICIPSDFADNRKRDSDTVRVRKVFSAIMSTPVDIEYQIQSFIDESLPVTTNPTVLENNKWKTEESVKVYPVTNNDQVRPEINKVKWKPEEIVTTIPIKNYKDKFENEETTTIFTPSVTSLMPSQFSTTDNIVVSVKAYTLTTPTKILTFAITGASFTPTLLTSVQRSVDNYSLKKAGKGRWQHITMRGVDSQHRSTEIPRSKAILSFTKQDPTTILSLKDTNSVNSASATQSSELPTLNELTSLSTLLHVSISNPSTIDNERLYSMPMLDQKTATSTESSLNVVVSLSDPQLMETATEPLYIIHETTTQPTLNFKLTNKLVATSNIRRSTSGQFGEKFSITKLIDLSEPLNKMKPSIKNTDSFKQNDEEDNDDKETLQVADALSKTESSTTPTLNALTNDSDKDGSIVSLTNLFTVVGNTNTDNDKHNITNLTKSPNTEKFKPLFMRAEEMSPNITTSNSVSSGRVTLSKEFIAAVDNRVIQLFLNLTRLQNKGLLQKLKVKRDTQNLGNMNKLDWDVIKKIFKRDAHCHCQCRDNKVMCRSCAVTDTVLTHLINEFDNLTRFLSEHCSEVQEYLYKNPTGRRRLREILHRIDSSMNAYDARLNGKCQPRCNNVTDNNVKMSTEEILNTRNCSDSLNLQQLFSLSNNLNKAINLDICPTTNLTKSAKNFYEHAKSCFISQNTTNDKVKNVYALDKINVNIICKPNDTANKKTTTEIIETFETIEQDSDSNNDQNEVNEPETTYATTKKFNGIKNLFLFKSGAKHKHPKTSYSRNYLVGRDTGVWIPAIKTKRKRNTDYKSQIESPIITDSGGSFWYEYLNRNGRDSGCNQNSPKIKKGLFKSHIRYGHTTSVPKLKVKAGTMELMTSVGDVFPDIDEVPQTFYNVNIFGTVNPEQTESSTAKGCICTKQKNKKTERTKTPKTTTTQRSSDETTITTSRKPQTTHAISTTTKLLPTKIESVQKKVNWNSKSTKQTQKKPIITITTTTTSTIKTTVNKITDKQKMWQKILSTLDFYRKPNKANLYYENSNVQSNDPTEALSDHGENKRSVKPAVTQKKDGSNLLLSIYLYKKRRSDDDWITLTPMEDNTSNLSFNTTDLIKQSAKIIIDNFAQTDSTTPKPKSHNLRTFYPELQNLLIKFKALKKKVAPQTKENDLPLNKRMEVRHFEDRAEEPDLNKLVCDLPATYGHIINMQTHLSPPNFEKYIKTIKCYKYKPNPTVFHLKREMTSKISRNLFKPKPTVKWNWIRRKRYIRIGQVREREEKPSVRGKKDFEEFVKDVSGVYRVKYDRRGKRQTDESEDEVTSMDNEIFAHLGDTIIIKCEPDDSPSHTATKAPFWEYNSQLFNTGNIDVSGNVITLRSVQPNNDGEYYCKTRAMNKRVKLTVVTLPSANIVFMPVYSSESDCDNITKSFPFLDTLAREMSVYLCPTSSYCTVSLHEPFCVRDPRYNKAHVQSTAIVTINPPPLTCSVECRKGLLSALSSLSVNNFKYVFSTPVLISFGAYNQTIYPASKKEAYGFWRHSLIPYPGYTNNEKSERFGIYQLAKRANAFIMKSIRNMSPGHVRALATCPAGQYLVRRRSLCAMCPANSWSLPGQNYCVSNPADTNDTSARTRYRYRSRRFGFRGTSVVYLLLYVLAACTALACAAAVWARVRRRRARAAAGHLRSSVMDLPPARTTAAHHYSSTSTRRRPLSPSRVILTRLFNSPTRRGHDAQEDKFRMWKLQNSRPPVPPVDFDW